MEVAVGTARWAVTVFLAGVLVAASPGGRVAGGGAAGGAERGLCFAISAMVSPARTFTDYRAFVRLFAKRLGKPVELKQRKTYEEVNELLRTGNADCGLVCTGAFIHADRHFKETVVAVPVMHGKETYRAYVIVRKDRPYTRFEDLKGKVFAFTDELSNTGALYPTYVLAKRGETPDDYFSYTFFTHSHDKSVEAVARGLADGAAVDSLVYDALVAAGDPNAATTRVIQHSPPFGIPPVVVSPKLPPDHREEIAHALLTFADDAEGKAALARLGIDRFARPPAHLYDSVRDMETFVDRFRKQHHTTAE